MGYRILRYRVRAVLRWRVLVRLDQPMKGRIPQPFNYVVEGTGPFPFDMLRYDRCWPRYESEVGVMGVCRGGIRAIHMQGLREPTVGRWESFGWRINARDLVS